MGIVQQDILQRKNLVLSPAGFFMGGGASPLQVDYNDLVNIVNESFSANALFMIQYMEFQPVTRGVNKLNTFVNCGWPSLPT